MDIIFSILFILGALFAGAISPGPSFVLVARISIGVSRQDGVAASLGMGLGGMMLSILALSGLHAALVNVPLLYLAFKVFGGLYLVFLAYRILNSADDPMPTNKLRNDTNSTFTKSFLLALVTQISNPKAAIIYGGVFAALLPTSFPTWVYFVLPVLIFALETGWYLVVTFVLSSHAPQRVYLKSKLNIDRVSGGIMALLGGKLISSAFLKS